MKQKTKCCKVKGEVKGSHQHRVAMQRGGMRGEGTVLGQRDYGPHRVVREEGVPVNAPNF